MNKLATCFYLILLAFCFFASPVFSQEQNLEQNNQANLDEPTAQPIEFNSAKFGVTLTFPTGWVVEPQEDKRAAKAEEVQGVYSRENLTDRTKGLLGQPLFPGGEEEQAIDQLVGDLTNASVSAVPIVSAYHNDPQQIEIAERPHIYLRVKPISSNDPFAEERSAWQLSVKFAKGTFVVPPNEFNHKGIDAIGTIYNYQSLSSGVEITQEDYAFRHGQELLTLSLIAPSSEVESLRMDFDSVLDSLVLR